jgi:two-component system nitrogen regulation sensor histidine kinase NtrY
MNAKKLKRILIIIVSLLALFLTTWLELFLQRKQNFIGAGINRTFLFLLINLHVIIIAFLLFVIIRQSIKLFLELRRSTPGSLFKRNLLFALTLFSVIPSFFVFFTAGKFISTSIDDWFHARISQGLKNSLELHKIQTHDIRKQLEAHGQELLSNILSQIRKDDLENSESIELCKVEFENLKAKHPAAENYSFYVWTTDRTGIVGRLKNEILIWRNYRKLNDRTTHYLKKEFFHAITNHEKENPFDFYGSLYWVKQVGGLYFLLVQRYPEAIRNPLIAIQNSISDYQQLKSMRNPIFFSYICTFLLVTLLILLLSIWCAFFFARGLIHPIQELIDAMTKIKNANWDVQIIKHPENDLQHLTHGFNDMVNALKSAHIKLQEKNREMMLILENIKAAVFLINKFGRLITFNTHGQKLIENYLGITNYKDKKINIFGNKIKSKILELARELIKSQREYITKEQSFSHKGEEKTFMIHLAKINLNLGLQKTEQALLFFVEDVTDIVKIKTIKAWQEAAKQMAHEIKNPLTPIQIATQHLQRKYGPILSYDQTFIDCTDTILSQVKTIKDLVAHFSKFASMPSISLEPANLNTLITETICLYRVSYPEIDFIQDLDPAIPELNTDKKKIRRVLINLLDNSVRALQQETDQKPGFQPIIKIQTKFSDNQKTVELLFADNGPGIPKIVQNKMFMPYVSTEKKNMGLGLAIIREIIEQLGGKITLKQSLRGAQFKIELPLN